MTVCELCELYVKNFENMEIFDTDEQATIFRGTFKEAKNSKYENEFVSSFSIENGIIVINI